MAKIQLIMDGDYDKMDEFDGEFVGQKKGVLTFSTPYGNRTYRADRAEWAVVDKFSYEHSNSRPGAN